MFGIMKLTSFSFALMIAFSSQAFAQESSPPIQIEPSEPIEAPDIAPEVTPETIIDSDDELKSVEKPDYSDLTEEAERTARLDELFIRLQAKTNEEDANLVAEEIWAIWLDSGSDTVNFILRRGTAAQKRNDNKLARRMYDHVTSLNPKYAEGWARSSRLALEEKDLGRALTEAAQALIYEPRHFYALWTMGNVFEQLGRQDEALEAYREANKLYPELKAVKDRVEALQNNIDGDVL
ncbi:tetratricopeptide repeat protein [Hellea balneolensis]|uniref:tetratricopeptide repeat protein n=1 Tax=Hellea balneolensis TaxID=287478 RepID=UPI000423A9EF|nr:tetratricopeptide repeat protein [Hellea balneolensis]